MAFSCRDLDPEREEKLRAMMAEFGPQLQTAVAAPDEQQLVRIREEEETLGLSLVAVVQ